MHDEASGFLGGGVFMWILRKKVIDCSAQFHIFVVIPFIDFNISDAFVKGRTMGHILT